MSAAVVFLVVAAICAMAAFSLKKLQIDQASHAVGGVIDLSQGEDLSSELVSLLGEWEGADGKIAHFPISSIVQAKTDAAYRLRMKLPEKLPQDLFLYIPAYFDGIQLFVNGEEQREPQETPQWVDSRLFRTMIPITGFDESLPEQELELRGDFSQNETTLYKRAVILGTAQNISTLAALNVANEMFLLGIILLVLINGFVFMLFRPSHLMISLITLFDTMIMMRVFFTMEYTRAYLRGIFPTIVLSDKACNALSLFFLLLGGVLGCILSEKLFDPEKKAPRWLVVPLPWVYAVFALVFPFFPGLFEAVGSKVLIVVYVITFIGVFWQFTICWRSQKSVYYLLQFIKTCYVGLIVFVDITLWTKTGNSLLLLYLYGAFLAMHIVVRLYDNNQSYHYVEELNQRLESTVEERTQELLQANRVLAELSVRDVLTKLYNRLYFERALERAFLDETQTLHLCMFDLDHFKSINDTYGHDAGDEQLKGMAKLVSRLVGEEAVFARIGGEEFVLLFEGKETAAVLDCVGAVHQAIAEDAGKNQQHTTASFGVTKREPGDSRKSLLKKADVALYQAKETGRNRIVVDFMN